MTITFSNADISAVGIGFSQAGIDRDCPVKIGAGAVKVPLDSINEAAAYIGCGQSRTDPNRRIEISHGIVNKMLPITHHAPIRISDSRERIDDADMIKCAA